MNRLRLGRESVLAALGAFALALLALRARPGWTRGVVGEGDAWQNLWNLEHVGRWLRGTGSLFFTDRLWAPEGASLLAHTLSLPNTIPGALLARLTGPFLAINLLVAASYVLAAVAAHRLARRLGAAPWGAALGAFVFAFNPQRSARALGHLNLLSTGWLALALEALFVATRRETKRPALAAAGAGLSLTALAYSDWYLALCGALAAGAFVLVELARAEDRTARRRTVGAALLAAAVAGAFTGPYALALAREAAREGTPGHEARWCGTAATSLVIPCRVQLAALVTRPLTERNHQNRAEGAGYLGLVPILATLAVGVGRRREKALDFALVAGGLGVLLALGPQLRVFDRLLELPLPYALAERLFPPLRVGGCPNRYIAVAFLPLALGTALLATRLLARGRRALVAVGALAIVLEYAPVDPGLSLWPFLPPDPSMEAIARAPGTGIVLDLDRTTPALIRQLRHGRPQLLGYLSRTPASLERRRLEDPIVGPLLDAGRPPVPVTPDLAAALLRSRWCVEFLAADDGSPAAARAARLGFPVFSRTEGRSIVFRVPAGPLGPGTGTLTWGLDAERRIGAEAGLLTSAVPGDYALRVDAGAPTRLALRWGTDPERVRTVQGIETLPVAVRPADLTDGALLLTIAAEAFGGAPGPRLLGFERR